jgi:hypothetical protein
MGRDSRDAVHPGAGSSHHVRVRGRGQGSGLTGTSSGGKDGGGPAYGSAFLFFRGHAWGVCGCRAAVTAVILTLATVTLAVSLLAPAVVRAEQETLGSEAACSLVRASMRRLAKAERNQALALHLMPEGKPTPMAQARFTELEAEIADLRKVLKRVREGAQPGDPYVRRCVDMGFSSLIEGETLINRLRPMVMSDGGMWGIDSLLMSGELPAERQLLPGQQPLLGAPARSEPAHPLR